MKHMRLCAPAFVASIMETQTNLQAAHFAPATAGQAGLKENGQGF
jgi:hypothetical protein